MIQKLFTVYDSKAEAHGRINLELSANAALRAFTDEVNSQNPDSQLAKHPEDFTLIELGTFDLVSGLITPLPIKKEIANGATLIRDNVSKLA